MVVAANGSGGTPSTSRRSRESARTSAKNSPCAPTAMLPSRSLTQNVVPSTTVTAPPAGSMETGSSDGFHGSLPTAVISSPHAAHPTDHQTWGPTVPGPCFHTFAAPNHGRRRFARQTGRVITAVRIGLVAPPWIPVPPPSYGGTELVVGQLAAKLVEHGHEVVLVAHPDSDV